VSQVVPALNGKACGCYGAETCDGLCAADAGTSGTRAVATCPGTGSSAEWSVQMEPCPVPCGQMTCTPPQQVCVETTSADGGSPTYACFDDVCVAGMTLSCSDPCLTNLCPNGTSCVSATSTTVVCE
jgi:hypothetical protein